MKKSLQERFEAKVNRAGDCHEWTGCLMPSGYGQIHVSGKTAYAHRVSWELKNGLIKNGEYVLHKCDNRKCVNINHLFLGTFDENMADMVSKRRQAHGRRNPHAKLTEQQVTAIKSATGTQLQIAKQYGVAQGLVSMIKSGRIWKYV